MISILHLSDFHFTRDAAMHNMRQVVKNEARERTHDKPKGEKLLIVTGDFHNFWAADYQDAIQFLKDIIEAMDIDPSQDVFVVPGNHDVADDHVIEPLIKERIPDWKKHKKSALKMLSDGDMSYVDWRLEMFIPYCEFTRKSGLYPETSDPFSDTLPAQVHIRKWRNKLNILHLNTALVADGKSKNNQVADITTATDGFLWKDFYRDDIPALAIGHNSFFDLKTTQQLALEATFAHRNVSAYLCGDTHLVNITPNEQTIPIEPGMDSEAKRIPNIICAKSVADLTDTYSDFGYYWHDWDEATDYVRVQFYRWRQENLAEAIPEGLVGRYKMRRKNVGTVLPPMKSSVWEKSGGANQKKYAFEANEPQSISEKSVVAPFSSAEELIKQKEYSSAIISAASELEYYVSKASRNNKRRLKATTEMIRDVGRSYYDDEVLTSILRLPQAITYEHYIASARDANDYLNFAKVVASIFSTEAR